MLGEKRVRKAKNGYVFGEQVIFFARASFTFGNKQYLIDGLCTGRLSESKKYGLELQLTVYSHNKYVKVRRRRNPSPWARGEIFIKLIPENIEVVAFTFKEFLEILEKKAEEIGVSKQNGEERSK